MENVARILCHFSNSTNVLVIIHCERKCGLVVGWISLSIRGGYFVTHADAVLGRLSEMCIESASPLITVLVNNVVFARSSTCYGNRDAITVTYHDSGLSNLYCS